MIAVYPPETLPSKRALLQLRQERNVVVQRHADAHSAAHLRVECRAQSPCRRAHSVRRHLAHVARPCLRHKSKYSESIVTQKN